MKYTPNSDPKYYSENQDTSNCGSFAFRLKEWYNPDSDLEDELGDSINHWINEMGMEGYEDWEISDMYADMLLKYILLDFEDSIRMIGPDDQPRDDEELIGFATFCYDCSEWDEEGEHDFHFKVFRDGEWMEKCGVDPVRYCEEDDWGSYISDVYYLAHKIA